MLAVQPGNIRNIHVLTPSFPEAALLTMGVSSAHKFLKWLEKKFHMIIHSIGLMMLKEKQS